MSSFSSRVFRLWILGVRPSQFQDDIFIFIFFGGGSSVAEAVGGADCHNGGVEDEGRDGAAGASEAEMEEVVLEVSLGKVWKLF